MNAATNPPDVCLRPLHEAADLVRRRQISPLELTRATLARIERVGPELNCYLSLAGDAAISRAQWLTAELVAGRYRGPLHGVPISLKDNIATTDLATTAGSPGLANQHPTRPATVVRRLEAAGAVIIGKCHLYELAYGAHHQAYGEVHNPWNLGHACGGSSSGCAAALAGGLCHGSIGTDSGGSIRIPASFCGVVGLKPTYGLVSRTGVLPVSANLDHVGPMARTVTDIAILLEAIAEDPPKGAGPPDKNREARNPGTDLEAGVAGLRLGVARAQASELIDPEVQAAVAKAVSVLADEGASLSEVELPDLIQARTVMWIITAVEAAEYHRHQLRTRGNDLHPLVRELLERGERIPATEYVHAQRVRQLMIEQVQAALTAVEALVLPATPITAFVLGEQTAWILDREEHIQPLMNRYTPLFDLTGQPAIALPCGFSSHGLPIGLQVVARPFDDATVLRVARAYERATDWLERTPQLKQSPIGSG